MTKLCIIYHCYWSCNVINQHSYSWLGSHRSNFFRGFVKRFLLRYRGGGSDCDHPSWCPAGWTPSGGSACDCCLALAQAQRRLVPAGLGCHATNMLFLCLWLVSIYSKNEIHVTYIYIYIYIYNIWLYMYICYINISTNIYIIIIITIIIIIIIIIISLSPSPSPFYIICPFAWHFDGKRVASSIPYPSRWSNRSWFSRPGLARFGGVKTITKLKNWSVNDCL